MNIWVIGKGIPKESNNMYGSFEFEQAQMLARHGIKVVYIGLDFRPIHRWRKWGTSRSELGGMPAYELCLPIRPLPFIQNRLEFLFCKKLYEEIEKEQQTPDVIHVHFPALRSYLVHALYQKKGVKIVATEHWSQVQKKAVSKQYFDNLCWFARNADAFACVGEPLKQSIKELTKTEKPIMVIPNIINENFQYSKAAEDGKYKLLGVGRLVKGKRFDLMISAFSKAYADNPNVTLKLVGGGEEYDRLSKQIKECKLEDRVILTGVKTREETAKEVAQCDALICASNFETFGVPVIEAWACGKPVIGTDALGFLEYMDDRLGCIVAANDEKQMIDAMRQLYDKRDTFDGTWISEFAFENFGEDAVIARICALYDQITQ